MKKTLLLLLFALCSLISQAQVLEMPTGGGKIATREWVEQYIFQRLGELGLSNCTMTINDIEQDTVENNISFAIGNPIQDVTTYQVEIRKGTTSWFYTSIPYQTGERLTVTGIQATGTVLITVSPTGRPSCYASASYDLLGEVIGPVGNCSEGPTVLSVTNVTDTTLTASFHGVGVTDIRWKILNSSGTQVHTATIQPGSSILNLTFPQLIPGNYTLLFEGLNCVGSSSLGFTVVAPLAACEQGPDIISVSSITGTGASVSFHGVNVTSLNWKVKDGATVLYNTTFTPTSSTFNITYSLGAGTYKLVLAGVNCSGSDSLDFTVPASGEGSSSGSGSGWQYIGQTDTTFLKIQVSGSPGAWLISDVSTFTPASGYEERYWINDVLVKGSKLTNYAYNSNYVLDIKKHSVKPAVPDDMSTWTVDGWPGSATDNGQVFGPRSDVGGQTVILFQSDDNKAGLQWLDRTPSWYVGDHTVSWPTKAPNMTLPSGKYMMYSFKLYGTDQNTRQAKGETFTPEHTDLTKRIGIVAGSNALGITDANASQSQFRTWADGWPLYGSQAFEWNEGSNSIPHMSNQERWYIERLKERYTAAGRTNYVLMPDYGGYDYVTQSTWPNHNNSVNAADLRWRYTGSQGDLLTGDSYLGFFNGYANAVNLKHYGTNPQYPYTNMTRIAKIESIKKAGYKAITFGWGQMEVLGPTGWVAGFGWQTNHPSGGVVQRNSLAQIPFDDAVANGFISLWWGDGFWCWDGQGIRSSDPATMDYTYNAAQTTLLSGATVLAANGGSVGNYQPAPDVALDGYYIGAYLFNQCAPTQGGTRFYATYTIDGTTYNAEPDGSDALTAYIQQRGICNVRVKDGKATIVYYNPYATNSWKTFSVNVYGTTFTGQVFGKRMYIANVTL